jgi:hypothetical protein
MKDIYSALEEFSNYLYETYNSLSCYKLDKLIEKYNWKPVTEEPTESDFYLCLIEKGEYSKVWYEILGGWNDDTVEYWMPLNSPKYKEK